MPAIEPHSLAAPPHAVWCAENHGPNGRCRRVIGKVGPLSVGLIVGRAGDVRLRLLDPTRQTALDINAGDSAVLVEAIGLAQRLLGAGTGSDTAGMHFLNDGYDHDPLVLTAVRSIRQFSGFDVDHQSTANEVIVFSGVRDEIDDEQLEAVLARFPQNERPSSDGATLESGR